MSFVTWCSTERGGAVRGAECVDSPALVFGERVSEGRKSTTRALAVGVTPWSATHWEIRDLMQRGRNGVTDKPWRRAESLKEDPRPRRR